MGLRRGDDVEGQRQQRVAGEDGRRLVESLVHGRAAAAQVVVVHRRQIVVDERIAVQQFERRAGARHALARGAEQPRRLDHQKRPQPLAAAQHGVPHRGEKA
jgi:hypothetical protein